MLLTPAPPSPSRLPATMPLERLVRAAQDGDANAWDEIVRRFSGLVWAIARSHRLSHADAQDAAQETWVRLARNLDGVRDARALGGWLSTIARNECLRTIQRSGRQVPFADFPDVADERDGVDAELLAAERVAVLRRALSRLGERDQALLRMLTADPAPSYSDISAALAMPIGSIGPTRARALERLRREIARCGELEQLQA